MIVSKRSPRVIFSRKMCIRDSNVGVESAHKSEEAVETGAYLVREGYRSHKLKPYRKAAQAERQLEKANAVSYTHLSGGKCFREIPFPVCCPAWGAAKFLA